MEGSVGDIATAVIAKLRNQAFSTLHELNVAIAEKIADYNAAPFQKREGSRKLVFDEVESAFLMPLPKAPFEVCDWVYGRTVNLDFHVVLEKNRYSVPFQHVGAKADLRVTANAVDVYIGGNRVASHPRLPSFVQYRYQTDPAHMPPQFVSSEWDERRILGWAREIGPATYEVAHRVFGSVQVPEQAYDPSLAILNLTRRYTEAELEDACAYALSRATSPRCKFIKTVLASNAANGYGASDEPSPSGYIRGEGYYDNGKEG